MAYELIWSPVARDDLRDIVRFIALDNLQRAEVFAYRLIRQTDVLQTHPEIGRAVPEYRNRSIRELIFKPYRIVHRVDHDRKCVEIIRVWHAARGIPKM